MNFRGNNYGQVLVLVGMMTLGGTALGQLRVNEILASNSATNPDSFGEFDDWIEVYNPGAEAVDLGGYYISDRLDDLTKHQIPTGSPGETTVPAGGFLLLWADNEPIQGPTHLSFALGASGEDVALTSPDGVTLIDGFTFGPQTTDVSYGRVPDGGSDFQFFNSPTAESSNGEGNLGPVADVLVNNGRGFYEDPLEVVLSTIMADATIVYTLDGTEPTEGSLVYTEPLNVDNTTTLRARGLQEGYSPGRITTHTYIFVDDVKNQSPNGERPGPSWPLPNTNLNIGRLMDYGMDPNVVNDPRYVERIDDALLALPTMSMVTDNENLFNPTTGIYAVPSGEGEEWERPVSLELIYPDGTSGFQIDCGTRIRGSSSANINNPKHAFRFFFRSEYGASELNYPLFGDEGVDVFNKVDLRTTQNFSWARDLTAMLGGTMNREVLWRDTQRAMGQPYTRSRYYHLYINGHYWGIYQTQERSEAWFAESYMEGDREDFDVIKANSTAVHVTGATDGNEDLWRTLWEASVAGFDSEEAYYNIQGLNTDGVRDENFTRLVDLENLIDYMLVVFVSASIDGPLGKWSNDTLVNNYYAIINRENPDGFKHFVHDFETSMMFLFENRIGPFGAGEQYASMSAQYLHERLAEHPEYRLQFADRVRRHLFHEGVLTPNSITERFMNRAKEIEVAIIAESARWGDAQKEPPATLDETWIPSVNDLVTNFFPFRTGVVLGQLRNAGLYPMLGAPEFRIDDEVQYGGSIQPGALLTIDSPNPESTVYYTLDGSGVRTPLRAGDSGRSLLVDEQAEKKLLVPSGPVADDWRSSLAFDDTSWTTATGVVGFENATGFESIIDYNVGLEMFGRQGTCYLRIPFTVDGAVLEELQSLSLSIRYDDAFIVYLNGTEVHREDFIGTPLWNSTSSSGRPDSSAPVLFDISENLGLLNPGQNLLAIHAMNASLTSSDFLMGASLLGFRPATEGSGGEITANARVYTGPIALGETAQVRARALENGTWSALSDALFVVSDQGETRDGWYLF